MISFSSSIVITDHVYSSYYCAWTLIWCRVRVRTSPSLSVIKSSLWHLLDCHFSSIYSYHGHILMNSSSHIVIIIICLNLLQTRISYLNHLAIFRFGWLYLKHHPLVDFSSSKFAPNKEETSCWWSHSKVYMPNKEEPLVGFSQHLCRARNYASCWLFPKSLKVYAEQGIMPLVGFIISSSSCA